MFYVSHNISILFYYLFFFFFNDPPTTEIYTLSLHDALPISCEARFPRVDAWSAILFFGHCWQVFPGDGNSRIIHLPAVTRHVAIQGASPRRPPKPHTTASVNALPPGSLLAGWRNSLYGRGLCSPFLGWKSESCETCHPSSCSRDSSPGCIGGAVRRRAGREQLRVWRCRELPACARRWPRQGP